MQFFGNKLKYTQPQILQVKNSHLIINALYPSHLEIPPSCLWKLSVLQISLWHQISKIPMPFLTQLLAKMTAIPVDMCGTFLSKFDFRGTCVNNCNFYLFFFLSQLQTKSNLTVSLSSMSHWWQKQNGTINYLLHMTWDSLLVYSLSESSHLHWIWGLSVHLQLLY